MAQDSPAPGRLEIVRGFINTLDVETGTDQLSTADGLAAWLSEAGLAGPASTPGAGDGGAVTPAERAYAVELREALRSVLGAHVGPHGDTSRAVCDLRALTAGLPARFEVGPDGALAVVAAGYGTGAALAKILVIAAESATLGTWARLKACSAGDCQWAFYDRSPTRSGCWCSMAVCGSRAKSRAYRRRATATG